MDSSLEITTDSCSEYIYSDNYIGYFIKYDNDLQGVKEIVNPDCIKIINNRFLVAYKQAPGTETPEELSDFFEYGYHNLPKLYKTMDVSAAEDIGAIAVRDIPGLRLSGRDVIIGFVDTGIDFRNPIFLDRAGNTRIEYIWDQNQISYGVGRPVFGFGGEFTGEEINRAISGEDLSPADILPGDEDGHGTFLASIAGGNQVPEENFTGVAPEASIIMVKLKEAPTPLKKFYKYSPEEVCYSEADIALGISYLIQKAVQLAKPMVICIGLGTTLGDHNGSSNLELYIENQSGLRGICFVAPVGNELGRGLHYLGGVNYPVVGPYMTDSGAIGFGTPDAEASLTPEVMEIYVEGELDGFILEIWGNAPGLLRLKLQSPSGQSMENISPNTSGSSFEEFVFEGTGIFVENVVVDALSGDQVYFVRFSRPAQGIWRVLVQETINQLGGGFNGWITAGGLQGGRVSFIKPSPEITVTAPGSSQGVITVAAYNNDNNSIYSSSGRGYTRKGSIKPDITAPGVDIRGVFGLGGAATSRRILYSNRSGTSIAAAFTAGAAALLLQWGIVDRNNLGINTEIIKQMLIRGANRDSDDVYPNNIWGWGELDLLKTFDISR